MLLFTIAVESEKKIFDLKKRNNISVKHRRRDLRSCGQMCRVSLNAICEQTAEMSVGPQKPQRTGFENSPGLKESQVSVQDGL